MNVAQFVVSSTYEQSPGFDPHLALHKLDMVEVCNPSITEVEVKRIRNSRSSLGYIAEFEASLGYTDHATTTPLQDNRTGPTESTF